MTFPTPGRIVGSESSTWLRSERPLWKQGKRVRTVGEDCSGTGAADCGEPDDGEEQPCALQAGDRTRENEVVSQESSRQPQRYVTHVGLSCRSRGATGSSLPHNPDVSIVTSTLHHADSQQTQQVSEHCIVQMSFTSSQFPVRGSRFSPSWGSTARRAGRGASYGESRPIAPSVSGCAAATSPKRGGNGRGAGFGP